MVRQRNSFHSRRSGHDGVLCQVECEMRGGGSATTIPHDKDTTALVIGLFQQRQYFLQMHLRDRSQHLLKITEIRVYRCPCFHCLLPLFSYPYAFRNAAAASFSSECKEISYHVRLGLCVRRYPVWAKAGHVEHNRGPLMIETEVHALQPSLLQRPGNALLRLLQAVEQEE